MMSDLLLSVPWWFWALLIVGLCAAAWAIDSRAYRSGRYDALHEADQRDKHRDRLDYQRGVFDTVRRAGEFLRKRGALADAAALPVALLQDQSSDQP